jgi:hypothetical protein
MSLRRKCFQRWGRPNGDRITHCYSCEPAWKLNGLLDSLAATPSPMHTTAHSFDAHPFARDLARVNTSAVAIRIIATALMRARIRHAIVDETKVSKRALQQKM